LYTKELVNALNAFASSHTYSYFTDRANIDPSADIVHYPYFDPFFLTLPWKKSTPTVVTVHDLIPIEYETHFPRGIRGSLKWQLQKYALWRTADTIITDSVASQQAIVRIMGMDSERVVAVPLAARSSIQLMKDKKRLSEIAKKYKLSSKFILYVGDINWNKNILGILSAYSKYATKEKSPVPLVCVGAAFTNMSIPEAQEIHARIRAMRLENHVLCTGFVADEELCGLYSLASVFLYPSFAEGFGFPVLEAMTCGCPVITSNVSSVVEIAGPATTVDPHKPEDIRHAIDMILSLSSAARAHLVAQGTAWASSFSWRKTAQRTVKIYEETLRHRARV
jgi:glycosyltransferase involved in cell wall biosynthesis